MSQILWFTFTWIAGTAAILGSLMTLGSLLLLIAPSQPRSHKLEQPLIAHHFWRKRLKLLAFSLTIALAGFGILVVVPFPSF
ncbi:MAG: hypothetical protein H7Z11_16750 [Verrucomicrobia bacterium]|nr:hypothetical protein [Leptolyngbya sp. ES-bin-22]